MTTWRVTFHCSFDIPEDNDIHDEDQAEELAWSNLLDLVSSGCSPDDFPATVEEINE